MHFDEDSFDKTKKAQLKMIGTQKQLNLATNNDDNTLKERLDLIELELIQIRQRLQALENQIGEPTAPPIDHTPPILTITPSDTFTGTKEIKISVNEPAIIYYTLDGSTRTINSTIYSTPFTITSTTILKTFAIDIAGNESTIETETYTFIETERPNDITNFYIFRKKQGNI